MTDAVPTNRWRGVLVLVLGAVGVGLVAKRPLALLLGALGIVYAAYPAIGSITRPQLTLDRRISDPRPTAGALVEVTATITNVGDRPLVDLRLVDGVPAALAVVEGSPRLGTALRAGESATLEYMLRASEGRHPFGALTAIARDIGGAHEIEVSVSEETTLVCRGEPGAAPPVDRTTAVPGSQPADTAGAGTEFHQTRAYQRGDPVGSIDWNRYARTGELTTIEFRAERAARIVLTVDVTPAAYRGRPDRPHAVAASIRAARELLASGLAEGHRVGLASLGRAAAWLPPNSGRDHRLEAGRLLATDPAFELRPPPSDSFTPVARQATALLARLEADSQLVFLSPLLSDAICEVALELEAGPHAVIVISPAVTVQSEAADGRALASIERRERVRRLRERGVDVVDWEPRRPLGATVGRQLEAGR